jgi:DNA-directed RNA polymerase specialized sigma24 family protein
LLLNHLWGFSAPEIAAVLHISVDAAAKRLSRAHTQFRQHYDKEWGTK